MFDFIWHLRGSVPVDGVGSDETTLDRVERLLERQGKDVSERGANYLAFDNPLWSNLFGPNWRAMAVYDAGRFWIEQGPGGRTLRYDVRSLHGMLFCLFAALIFFFFELASGGVVGGLKLGSFVFAWLYGMNVLLALGRVPSEIHKAVQST
jgi:hypothetical protein